MAPEENLEAALANILQSDPDAVASTLGPRDLKFAALGPLAEAKAIASVIHGLPDRASLEPNYARYLYSISKGINSTTRNPGAFKGKMAVDLISGIKENLVILRAMMARDGIPFKRKPEQPSAPYILFRDGSLFPPGTRFPLRDLVVLTGRNNSGKTRALSALEALARADWKTEFIDINRQHLSGQIQLKPTPAGGTSTVRELRPSKDSVAYRQYDPINEMQGLPEEFQTKLLEWYSARFGQLEFVPKRWAPPEVKIEGRDPSAQGTGSRSILHLLISIFDPHLEILLVDEPELGLEPWVQRELMLLLRAASRGEEGVPQKKVIIATHSHLFLDRDVVENNFVLERGNAEVTTLRQIQSRQELQSAVFRLLGNFPGDLFFPGNILIVEGRSDYIFLGRLLGLLGSPSIAIHFAENDVKIMHALPALDHMLKSLSYLLDYKSRICVLLDQQYRKGLVDEIRGFLDDKDGTRTVVLPRNGIEYYYPRSLLAELTGIRAEELDAAITQYLEALKAARSAALGGFKGGKVDLATAIANDLQERHLAEIDPVILQLLAEVKRRARPDFADEVAPTVKRS